MKCLSNKNLNGVDIELFNENDKFRLNLLFTKHESHCGYPYKLFIYFSHSDESDVTRYIKGQMSDRNLNL